MDTAGLTIRQEAPADYRAVEALTREAFWNVYRPGCLEHYLVHTLRGSPAFVPQLDLVLERAGQLIGHILYLRSSIRADSGRVVPTMTFGPLSIHPRFQRQGYGKFLLDRSVERAAQLGAGALCIEGNPAFYGKSGFVAGSSRGIRYFAPQLAPYFLLKELREGYLEGVTGVYRPPEGYFVDEGAAEAFDAAFPPKVKQRLPGQLG